MKFFLPLFISSLIILGLVSTSKADNDFDQTSYDRDIQRSRLENTWQFYGSLGLGVVSTNQNSDLKPFSDNNGFGLPVGVSLSVYHPRSSPGRIHWGYTIEGITFEKRKSSWIVDESNQYSQGMIGGGLLYYLDENKQTYFRSSLGLASASVTEKSKFILMDEEKKEVATYSRGVSLSTELGSTFKFETYKNLFTYAAHFSYLTATNQQNENRIEILSATACFGFLW